MNVHDRERSAFIYEERKKGRTLKSIASDLGISPERVRQIYRKEDWERNGTDSDAWKRLFKQHPEDAERLTSMIKRSRDT